ncbi:Putative ribonuclease H protein At1g65750 [Linum perenne]
MDNKLSGWKAKSLSLAGRATLAQSVLSAIPAYAMQTSVLPVTTCTEIDRRIRNFVWGSTDTEKKTHLISWETICLPKSEGGLGIRCARTLNGAYMTKLAFLFFQNQSSLWVRILQSKYFKTTTTGLAPRYQASKSAIWKGLSAEWDVMLRGSRAVVRNGKETQFWTTRWLDADILLTDFAIRDISEIDLQESVADFCLHDGWNYTKLRLFLSEEGVEFVAGMPAPKDEWGDDDWAWGCEKNGRFTIKSAYELILNNQRSATAEVWKTIWRWRGPNRIRHFLWLAGQDRLLTNDQRMRRKQTADPNCPWCPGQIENSIHVLRDCSFAKGVWNLVHHFDQTATVWSTQGEVWLSHFLSADKSLLFGVICWSLWKTRNAKVFTNACESTSSVAARACSWSRMVEGAMSRDARTSGDERVRQTLNIAWDPGPHGWATLNTDGAVVRESGKAAAAWVDFG